MTKRKRPHASPSQSEEPPHFDTRATDGGRDVQAGRGGFVGVGGPANATLHLMDRTTQCLGVPLGCNPLAPRIQPPSAWCTSALPSLSRSKERMWGVGGRGDGRSWMLTLRNVCPLDSYSRDAASSFSDLRSQLSQPPVSRHTNLRLALTICPWCSGRHPRRVGANYKRKHHQAAHTPCRPKDSVSRLQLYSSQREKAAQTPPAPEP